MFPVLYSLGDFHLPTYGVLVAAALVAGLMVAARLARHQGLHPDRAWDLGILAILCGIVGAKLLFVVQNWQYYGAHPREIFSLGVLQSGGVFYGGVLAALGGTVWYMRRHGLPWLKTADAFAPGLALGHAVGRLGCFSAGCCYGRPTSLPWGVTFTHPLAAQVSGTPLGVPLHPTQLYEAALEVATFFVLLWIFRHRHADGQVMGSYLFIYGFARYFLEFLRGEPQGLTFFSGSLTLMQAISLLLVVAGGALWLRRPDPAASPA